MNLEESKVKGPNTKLLECSGLVIRIISQNQTTENLEFEVFTANEEGFITSPEPIFRANETTPHPENVIEKSWTSAENREFNIVVLNNNKDNKDLDGTTFMEISKVKDPKKILYRVSAREKAEEESIGTIECHMMTFRIQFKINGSDTTYILEEKKFNRFSLECLLCCGRGSKIHSDQLAIYELEKSNADNLEDPRKKLDGHVVQEPVGKIVKLKRPASYIKQQDILISFPKGAYNEERSLLLALTFLLAARYLN